MTIDRRRLCSRAPAAFAACVLGWPVSGASAHEYGVGKIKIEHPWLRAPRDGETSAQLFMLVANAADWPDRLIAVKSANVGSADFHIAPHFAVREDAIYLPPLSKVTLAPGGSYVRLVDISKINPVGWGFEVTLVFEKAGEVTIDAAVDAPDAAHAHDAEAMERWRKAHGELREKQDQPTGHDQMNDHDAPGGEAAPAPKAD
jgi:copper(I)-binding protein